jgi:hypothetical protein
MSVKVTAKLDIIGGRASNGVTYFINRSADSKVGAAIAATDARRNVTHKRSVRHAFPVWWSRLPSAKQNYMHALRRPSRGVMERPAAWAETQSAGRIDA